MALKDKLKKINPKYYPVILLVAAGLVAAGFVFKLYLPLGGEIKTLSEERASLQATIEKNRVMVRKIDELKAANKKLDEDLKAAQERLPSSAEQVKLLENVSKLVEDSGLQLKSWEPGKTTAGPKGLYTEAMVKVKVVGSYHDFGKFMEGLDGLTRLITIADLEMSDAKLSGYKMSIPISFTLVAYSAGGGK